MTKNSQIFKKSVFLPSRKSDQNEEKQALRVLSPFSLGKQRQPYGLNVALATARSARRSRSKMGSLFRAKSKPQYKTKTLTSSP
ncbi:hypothetical protein QP017_05605 [Gallibacterium anatis]|uniref:hypothetical protein n=1 Tax=Gallibacterium anatis TaxID=750 RepID=UPI00254D4038|nr:hypothetical protein [Gallibacterium anatis]MDK9560857.1 hypothetical protein [Gallibacterium anatis]